MTRLAQQRRRCYRSPGNDGYAGNAPWIDVLLSALAFWWWIVHLWNCGIPPHKPRNNKVVIKADVVLAPTGTSPLNHITWIQFESPLSYVCIDRIHISVDLHIFHFSGFFWSCSCRLAPWSHAGTERYGWFRIPEDGDADAACICVYWRFCCCIVIAAIAVLPISGGAF